MSSKKLYMFGVSKHPSSGGYYVPCGTNHMLPIDGRLSKFNQLAVAEEKATRAKWVADGMVGFVVCAITDLPNSYALTAEQFNPI